MNTPFKSEA